MLKSDLPYVPCCNIYSLSLCVLIVHIKHVLSFKPHANYTIFSKPAPYNNQWIWISKTICETHSEPKPTFCDALSCEEDDTLKFEVIIKTDSTPKQNRLSIVKRGDDNKLENFIVQNKLEANKIQRFVYCLDNTQCYRFRLIDKEDNGIVDGYYEIYLNGAQLESHTFTGTKVAHNFNCQDTNPL